MAKNVNAKTWALEPDENGDRWSAGQAAANEPPVWSGAPSSLNLAASSLVNFYQWASDPNTDPLTYSLSQTPAGYSITSTGVLTVGPGNGTVVVRATDPGGLYAETACTVTIASVNAANFVIPADTAARTLACNQTIAYGTTSWASLSPTGKTQPVAGDVIELAGGTHGALTFNNLLGSSSNRITVRNASGATAVIRKQSVSASYGGFILLFNNCRYYNVDGSNGKPAGQYGIKVTYSVNSVRGTGLDTTNDRLAAFIKTSGPYRDCTFKRIEVDGGYTPRTHTTHFSTSGSGLTINDQAMKRLSGSTAGTWFENMRFTECYLHNIPSNALYIGSNWNSDSLPCRNMEIDNNIIHDTGQDGFTCKAWMGGTNSVHHNTVQYSGMDPRADGTYETHEGLTTGSVNQRLGFSIFDGYADVYCNEVQDAGRRLGVTPAAHGFSIASVYLTESENPIVTPGNDYTFVFPFTCRVYNNIMSRCDDRGSRLAATSTDAPPYVFYAYCNTVVENALDSIASSGNATGFIKNNVCVGNGTDAPSGPLTIADNLTNPSAAAILTNPASDNYTLLAAQPAVGTVGDPPTNEIPPTDFIGVVRTNGNADKGAYEKT